MSGIARMTWVTWIALVAIAPGFALAKKGPDPVVVENTEESPVPVEVIGGEVTTTPGGDRIIIRSTLSLQANDLIEESGALFVVPEGMRLVIEFVQADARGACSYKWFPTVQINRPQGNFTTFDRYDLDVQETELFTNFDYLSAGSYPVAISAYEGSEVRFSFQRGTGNCFGQADMFMDGRLEPGDAQLHP